MKVLFLTTLPFMLAHGGAQTLIESLMRELANLGVDIEPVRWWDENQSGDILHFIGRPSNQIVQFAKDKGIKVVMTENLDQTASRSAIRLWMQRQATRCANRFLPAMFTDRMGWRVYREVDAMIYVVPHEWEVAKSLFDAAPDRGHIVPHGLEQEALAALAQPQAEDDYLISIATIAPRKNTVRLARAALETKTPVVFLGKPYSVDDPYFVEFKQLVDGRYVRYPGFVPVGEKYRLLRGARGFVLLSEMESGCIAVYEAAAAGLPLLLSALPWAIKVYDKARKTDFVKLASQSGIEQRLRDFYSAAHREPGTTFPILTWRNVAERYRAIYELVLSGRGKNDPGDHAPQ